MTNQKLLDKKKTKELEYVITWVMAKANGIDDYNWGQKQFEKDLRKKLELLLTQQRTEILDEIDKSCKETPEIIKKWKCSEKDGWYIKNVIDSFKSQLTNLLNKKDE